MTGLVKKLLVCGAKSFRSMSSDHVELQDGHIWVCVGKGDEEVKRFEVETHYLNHPLFEDLLSMSVQELGYSYQGALRIACEVDLFLHLLGLIKTSHPSVHCLELHDLIDRFRAAGTDHEKPPQAGKRSSPWI
ncbi:Small auxin-up RNA protein [Dioscorea alata]|uniref:Small auxin-up RNA protein n=1 Tax=Dioscorea alata TaxID=55571 RepID=A0ACB7WNJ7_DIOAL|nr:Small auxin-up RNA protein [Dioscorea alata]